MRRKILCLLLTLLLLCPTAHMASLPYAGLFARLENNDTVTIDREEYEQFRDLILVYDTIMQNAYWDDIDPDALIDGALDGMLNAVGDGYTYYYSPDEALSEQESESGAYAGIGVEIAADPYSDVVYIYNVFNNSPAAIAGLQKYDTILRIDNHYISKENYSETTNFLRGAVGTTVEIEVRRSNRNLTFQIVRASVETEFVRGQVLQDNIGYIYISSFEGNAAWQFKELLQRLETYNISALIVDLRNNSGGYTSIAEEIADVFLDRELLYYTLDRDGNRQDFYTSDGMDDIPLVILVNSSTASASEILAGSLQNLRRAAVVGKQTFGKGIVQEIYELANRETYYQVTVAEYFFPEDVKVHGIGIIPDVAADDPPDGTFSGGTVNDDDTQLRAAWNIAKTLQ